MIEVGCGVWRDAFGCFEAPRINIRESCHLDTRNGHRLMNEFCTAVANANDSKADLIIGGKRGLGRCGNGSGNAGDLTEKLSAGIHGVMQRLQCINLSLSGGRDALDLDPHITGQTGDFNRGASRCGGHEVSSVNSIHGCELAHVFEVYSGLQDLLERTAAGGEHGLQILKNAFRLYGDIAFHNLHRCRIERNLSAQISNAVAGDSL